MEPRKAKQAYTKKQCETALQSFVLYAELNDIQTSCENYEKWAKGQEGVPVGDTCTKHLEGSLLRQLDRAREAVGLPRVPRAWSRRKVNLVKESQPQKQNMLML